MTIKKNYKSSKAMGVNYFKLNNNNKMSLNKSVYSKKIEM